MNDAAQPLSPREVEIFDLLASNYSTSDVADRLHLSEHTVRTHVKNGMRKLRVGSRAAAVGAIQRQRMAEMVAA